MRDRVQLPRLAATRQRSVREARPKRSAGASRLTSGERTEPRRNMVLTFQKYLKPEVIDSPFARPLTKLKIFIFRHLRLITTGPKTLVDFISSANGSACLRLIQAFGDAMPNNRNTEPDGLAYRSRRKKSIRDSSPAARATNRNGPGRVPNPWMREAKSPGGGGASG